MLINVQRNPETNQWPGLVDSFKTFHTTKKGEWVNEVAAEDYVSSILLFYYL